jgi:hypothetical protein
LSPLANNLLNSSEEENKLYPLEVKFCNECKNSQLSFVAPPREMFDNYLYVSSTAHSFRSHFENAAVKYASEFNLNENTLVVDIGSNDGIFLAPLIKMGIKSIGVEPAKNISDLANSNGILTINSYFDSVVVENITKEHGKAKIVTASNVFAHSDELISITKSVFDLLEEDGTFIVEVQYFYDTLKDLTFDNIYHEHCNYWTVTSLNNFFKNLGFSLNKVEKINTHGGSIRAYIDRKSNPDESVSELILAEDQYGMNDIGVYREFSERIEETKKNVLKNINSLKSKCKKISAYGSPAKATTALNYFGIDNSFIDFTVEDNLLKVGKLIPGVNIPIQDKKYLIENRPDAVIVLAWNFLEEIKKNNKEIIELGTKFISIKDLQDPAFEI